MFKYRLQVFLRVCRGTLLFYKFSIGHKLRNLKYIIILELKCTTMYKIYCRHNSQQITGGVGIIDMRRLSRPPPPSFPFCAGCVPFELVVSAAPLWRENGGGGGQIHTISNFHHLNIIMAALSTMHAVTGRSQVRVIYKWDIYGTRPILQVPYILIQLSKVIVSQYFTRVRGYV
jgi:hypothetical protein